MVQQNALKMILKATTQHSLGRALHVWTEIQWLADDI
jgi:hypothetical protein